MLHSPFLSWNCQTGITAFVPAGMLKVTRLVSWSTSMTGSTEEAFAMPASVGCTISSGAQAANAASVRTAMQKCLNMFFMTLSD